MRTRYAVPALVFCTIAALGAGSRAPRGNKPDPQPSDQPLPAPVQATVDKHLPGSKVTGYEHEVDEGRHLYFVDVTTAAGKSVTLLSSGRGQYLGQVVENEQDDDVFIDLATAPDAVREGIAKYYKTKTAEAAEIDNLFMEVEQSRFMFIVEKTKEKVSSWVTFTLGGVVVSVETEMDLKDLPQAVKDAVAKARPAAKTISAAITDEREKKTTFYTVEVTDGPSKLEMTVTPEGKVESTEPAEEDPPTKPA